MKPLTEYKKNGYRWSIIMRIGDIAMAHGDKSGGYEVFHVQSHNGREIAGKWCEPAEYPPSNEQWGSKGWSFSDHLTAGHRFCDEVNKAALAAIQ